MLLEVQRHHRLDARTLLGVEVATADEVLRQRSLPVARPRLKRRHELRLVDQAVLQRQQAEKQVAEGIVLRSNVIGSRSRIRGQCAPPASEIESDSDGTIVTDWDYNGEKP